MRIRLFVLVSIFICALAAQAQSELQTLAPEAAAWRAHLGDDPVYADPAFNDSSWPIVTMTRAGFPDAFLTGRSRWFRKRIALPPSPGPIDLLITSMLGSYEVYVDGRRVGPPIESSLRWRKSVTSIYPLRTASDPSLREVEVAIRSHVYLQPFSGRSD